MLPLFTYLALTLPGGEKIEAPKSVPTGGLQGGDGEKALQNGIQIFLTFVIVLSVIFLIWGGIKWITSSGDKTKLDSARKTILYAIIGLIVALSAFVIVNLTGTLVTGEALVK